MSFYNRLEEQQSAEYGNRIRIKTDLRKYRFELIYRATESGFHRTVTTYSEDGKVKSVDSHEQSMVGEFNRENIENQFDHFIDEEWKNYVN